MDKLKALAEQEQEEDSVAGNDEEEVRIDLKQPGSRTSSSVAGSLTLSHQCRNSPCPLLCLLRYHPLLLVAPALLLVVIIALCVFGVTFATEKRIDTQRELAQAAARDAADALRLQLSVVSGAALTMATFVQVNPDWNKLEEDFVTMSQEIFRQADESSSYELAELVYAPFGHIAANYAPPSSDRGPVRTDLFGPEAVDRAEPFETVKLGSMTIIGPLSLTVGGRMALIARYPVFIKNVSRDEDWNNPFNKTAPTGCEELCYDNTTRTKFWGFTNAFFYADDLASGEDERLQQLRDEDYEFRLTKSTNFSDPNDGERLIVKSSGWDDLEPTAVVDVRVPGAAWWLAVYDPVIDATRELRDGLIAMIVILAFLLSGLLLLLLVTNKRAALLLEEQLITNEALEQANGHLTSTKRILEDEKQQREALLSRQYDLISCFERKDSRKAHTLGKLSSSGDLSSRVTDKQHATLEQIATLRRQMDEERHPTHSIEDIRFCELLGEGTFGKVHRGIWRSTEVAIKTIVLPANMSGAEKREKMVVWEAAISSTLNHPNIVQTYTYSIKPVREQDKNPSLKGFGLSGLGSAVQVGRDSEQKPPSQEDNMQDSDNTVDTARIHSFEVSLVLEYCSKGTLRDALDQGAFITSAGLNYASILDSACDVARAMLHLHLNNILHMDLKARNILLASSGSEGRGVTCKASDFGLAVRMEQAETHMSGCFQGTLTHMAPETLLKGQVSKAADVYAFGIVLWELFTGGQPYQGIPKALLGHKVCTEGHRPPLPFVMPQGYQALVQACWACHPEHRPSFAEILDRLQALRSAIPGPTEPLGTIRRPLPMLPTTSDKGHISPLQGTKEHSAPSIKHSAPGVLEEYGSVQHTAHHHSYSGPVEGPGHFPEQAASPVGQGAKWDSSAHKARKMVRFFSAGARGERSDPEGAGKGKESEGVGVRQGSMSSAGSTAAAAAVGSREVEDGVMVGRQGSLKRSSSMPSVAQEGEVVPAQEQLPNSSGSLLLPNSSSSYLQNSSGSHLSGSGRSSHSHQSSTGSADSGGRFPVRVVSPFDDRFGGSIGTLFPLAPEQPSALVDSLIEGQPTSLMGPESARGSGGSGSTAPSANNQGRVSGTSNGNKSFPGPSSASKRHHRHSSKSAHRSWRSHGNSHCVMIIGSEEEYPENNTKEKRGGRVELSAVRTKAVLGNTLDPIGEDNHEGHSKDDLRTYTSS